VPLKAAFFDVGDTLVEHWAGRDVTNKIARAQICAAIGERPWLDGLLEAEIEPVLPRSFVQVIRGGGEIEARQETLRWYGDWFSGRGIPLDGVDLDQLRTLMCVPLKQISSPVPGAIDAVRWCAAEGMRVVLVTNTLARGDAEALADWREFGLGDAIYGVVSSHSAGYRKPHPAIFERALEISGADASEAFHIGDNLIADVWGAQQVGLRAIWRRSERARPPSDERGEPPARAARESTEPCRHPSERLFLDGSEVRCGRCGEPAGVEIEPDAVVDDLTQLRAAVAPWLGARAG
jgi:FMN phosphatase YigB (HAD superfamily)